jgi:hypothetical protein
VTPDEAVQAVEEAGDRYGGRLFPGTWCDRLAEYPLDVAMEALDVCVERWPESLSVDRWVAVCREVVRAEVRRDADPNRGPVPQRTPLLARECLAAIADALATPKPPHTCRTHPDETCRRCALGDEMRRTLDERIAQATQAHGRGGTRHGACRQCEGARWVPAGRHGDVRPCPACLPTVYDRLVAGARYAEAP